MPVQPDPTHPKFLEGDDVLRPANVDDDVEGHLGAAAVPDSEPEGMKTRNTDDAEGFVARNAEDVEGHLGAAAVPDSEPEGMKTRNTEDPDDVEGHRHAM